LAYGFLKHDGEHECCEMKKPVIAMETFDLRETIISFSLLQITNHFRKMNPGETVEIICADKSVTEDLKCLLPQCSYEFIRIENVSEDSSDFRIELKKINVTSP
jgi:TusA-related sulfurtransferase